MSNTMQARFDQFLVQLSQEDNELLIEVKDTVDSTVHSRSLTSQEALRLSRGIFPNVQELCKGLKQGFETSEQDMKASIDRKTRELAVFQKVVKANKTIKFRFVIALQERGSSSSSSMMQAKAVKNFDNWETQANSEMLIQPAFSDNGKTDYTLKTEQRTFFGKISNTFGRLVGGVATMRSAEEDKQKQQKKKKHQFAWWQSPPHYSGLFE